MDVSNFQINSNFAMLEYVETFPLIRNCYRIQAICIRVVLHMPFRETKIPIPFTTLYIDCPG